MHRLYVIAAVHVLAVSITGIVFPGFSCGLFLTCADACTASWECSAALTWMSTVLFAVGVTYAAAARSTHEDDLDENAAPHSSAAVLSVGGKLAVGLLMVIGYATGYVTLFTLLGGGVVDTILAVAIALGTHRYRPWTAIKRLAARGSTTGAAEGPAVANVRPEAAAAPRRHPSGVLWKFVAASGLFDALVGLSFLVGAMVSSNALDMMFLDIVPPRSDAQAGGSDEPECTSSLSGSVTVVLSIVFGVVAAFGTAQLLVAWTTRKAFRGNRLPKAVPLGAAVMKFASFFSIHGHVVFEGARFTAFAWVVSIADAVFAVVLTVLLVAPASRMSLFRNSDLDLDKGSDEELVE